MGGEGGGVGRARLVVGGAVGDRARQDDGSNPGTPDGDACAGPESWWGMIYGSRDKDGRIVCTVQMGIWRTPQGRWAIRTETHDDEGRKHSGFILGDDVDGWVFEADAEVALRQVVGDMLRGGPKVTP